MNKEEEKIKDKKVKETSKKKKNEEKLEELVKLQEASHLKDEKILRLSAEMQNMRRRFDDEKARLLKYDGEEVILKMLPILDNFEHAIKMDDNDLSDEISKFLNGFKMIYSSMIDTLKNLEVSEIDALHNPFDEVTMHAVLVDQDDAFADNIVLDVLQKGYKYKDKVLRPAMVKVNQKGEK